MCFLRKGANNADKIPFEPLFVQNRQINSVEGTPSDTELTKITVIFLVPVTSFVPRIPLVGIAFGTVGGSILRRIASSLS